MALFVGQDGMGKWKDDEHLSFLLNEKNSVRIKSAFPMEVCDIDALHAITIDIGEDSMSGVMGNFFNYLAGPCYSSDTNADTKGERYQKLLAFKEKWTNTLKKIDADYQKVLDNTFSLD